MLDVVALDKCLEEEGEDIDQALRAFSQRLELWSLLQLPPKGILGALYSLSQLLLGVLQRLPILRRWLPVPTQTALSQTLIPFSEIARRRNFWIDVATKRKTVVGDI